VWLVGFSGEGWGEGQYKNYHSRYQNTNNISGREHNPISTILFPEMFLGGGRTGKARNQSPKGKKGGSVRGKKGDQSPANTGDGRSGH